MTYAIDRFRWLDGRYGFTFHDRPYVQLINDKATADRGVEIRTSTPVESIRADDGTVTGVVTNAGPVAADVVVCAAGAGTAELVRPFIDIPVKRFVYCNLQVDRDSPASDDYPMLYGNHLWWRPEPECPSRLLVSGGMYFIPGVVGRLRNRPRSISTRFGLISRN